MRLLRPLMLAPLLLVAGACASTGSAPPAPADRVLAVDTDGRVIRRSALDERTHASFAAPIDRVWSALMLSYADAGIAPSVSDRAAGQYGNPGLALSRRFSGRPLSDFFDCGSGMTGPYVEAGRLTAHVLTTLSSATDSTTNAMTTVSGTLRRNDGASSDPIICASTGSLEELLRRGVEARLATAR